MRNPIPDPKPPSATVEPSAVERFKRWISLIQHNGSRGFYENELRAVHGKQYQKVMSDWIARGWLENRNNDRPNLWWISERGSRALESTAEKQQALQGSDP